MPTTIPTSQTRTVPQLTLASFALALSDLLHLHVVDPHNGASAGDFKLELSALRDWLLDGANLTGVTTSTGPTNEPANEEVVTVGWLNDAVAAINLVLADKLDASVFNDRYKGVYLTVEDLALAWPTAVPGDYATVDGGGDSAANMAIWDDSDNSWVVGSSISITNTDAVPEGNVNFYVTQEHVLDTFTRQTATVEEDLILQTGETFSGTITMSGQYRALQISTAGPMRVRLYTTPAKRDDDLLRGIGVPVPEGSGLMLEFVSTPGLLSADLTPVVDGFAATAEIPYSMVGTTIDGTYGMFSLNYVKTGV